MEASPAPARRRLRIRVGGVVQGVGFRPYVFRLAGELGLAGFVLNDPKGVVIEIEGDDAAVAGFLRRLPAEAPPLASIAEVVPTALEPVGEAGFVVGASRDGEAGAPVAADAATCPACLAELLDPGDRRHRYPFVNCTDCGPRFTIVDDVPYDRATTTMAGFPMCAACTAEYEDPASRRFQAQANACPDCGPRLGLIAPGEETERASGEEALRETVAALIAGRIVAVKGLGGYHLACRADDEAVVATLRARKHREDRPFALMVATIEDARRLVELTAAEEALLEGRERPILIARRLAGADVAESVAPGAMDLGVMLPYSPLHHLLAREAGVPLVMTSGNVSDEPIVYDDGDAAERMTGIADLICRHDRPIRTRTDDSVVRALDPAVRAEPLLIRRSRGFVPGALSLPIPARRPILGCGAELKSTFCLASDDRAWVSHHIGDLGNYETLASYREGVTRFERLFSARPALVAHDLHPDYLSTGYALEREAEATIAVQHHHAHLGAVLAEHGEHGPAVGAIFDGAGLGPDGTVWGGELLVGGLAGYERAGLLFPVRLPGGDAAAREPWRMACAWLAAALDDEDPPMPRVIGRELGRERWEAVAGLVRTGMASPLTTSAGRLFDAVASLCGLRQEVTYEGQAAVELEAAARRRGATDAEDGYPIDVVAEGDGPIVIDPREAIAAIAADCDRGAAVGDVAARFHAGLAGATASACTRLASGHGTGSVALAGGVFQNRLLLETTTSLLRRAGLRVLLPLRLPPNDGAISYGQAAIAACADASRP